MMHVFGLKAACCLRSIKLPLGAFCFIILKVKLTVLLLCFCVHSVRKGRPRNDLHCVGRDVKPYLLY